MVAYLVNLWHQKQVGGSADLLQFQGSFDSAISDGHR
jgi:hypothetical protein